MALQPQQEQQINELKQSTNDAQNDEPLKQEQQQEQEEQHKQEHEQKQEQQEEQQSNTTSTSSSSQASRVESKVLGVSTEVFFFEPRGIVIDERNQNTVIVADNEFPYLVLMNEDGTRERSGNYDLPGEDVELSCPQQIALHPTNNNLFIADFGNQNIQVMTTSGQCVTSFTDTTLAGSLSPSKLYEPTSVSISDEVKHNVVVSQYDGYVHLFSESDSHGYHCVRSFRKYGLHDDIVSVVSVSFDDTHQRILIGDTAPNKRLIVWSSDGSSFIKAIPLKEYLTAVHADRYQPNRYFVGTPGKVYVFDARMDTPVEVIGSECGSELGQLGGTVGGLCVNRQGILYVADSENQRVQWFSFA